MMLGTHFLHRLPKTENLFRPFLHFKLQPQQPSQHPENQSRQAACTPPPREDRLDCARGPQSPSRESSQCRLASRYRQNPQRAPCARPSLTLGQTLTLAGLSGTCLPSVTTSLLRQKSKGEWWQSREMGVCKPSSC